MPRLEAEPAAWAGRTILLAGVGHSAQTAARDLARFAQDAPGTRIVWAIRSRRPAWGTVENDSLPERAALNRAAAEIAAGASPAFDIRLGAVTERLAERDGRIAVTLRRRGRRHRRRPRARAERRGTATRRCTASSRSTSAMRPVGR